MPGIEQQRAIYRFGVFELNPRTGELRKQGVKLKLQDQPQHILTLLLEHAGEVVTREEIQKRLWPGNTYVDFDNAISSAVRKLREALGDSAENQRFIETLAKRGYRFIGPLEAPSPAVSEAKRKFLKAIPIAVGALLIVANASWWFWYRPESSPVSLTPYPLTAASAGKAIRPSRPMVIKSRMHGMRLGGEITRTFM